MDPLVLQQWIVFYSTILGCYLIGSIPTSIIVSKLIFKVDIRTVGSGNAGATNTFRVLGWKPALFVAVVDIVKGYIPTMIIASAVFIYQPLTNYSLFQIICGSAAVLGHNYTIFARFKGGKGVATLAGMLIALFPTAVPLCLAVFALTIMTTGFVSLASMLAAFSFPIFSYALPIVFTTIKPPSEALLYFSVAGAFFLVFSHRANVKRLLDGTENRFEKALVFRRKKTV